MSEMKELLGIMRSIEKIDRNIHSQLVTLNSAIQKMRGEEK